MNSNSLCVEHCESFSPFDQDENERMRHFFESLENESLVFLAVKTDIESTLSGLFA